MTDRSPQVSIIIRTKNEERWIGHCLRMVFNQNFEDFEVVLVDNQSSDHTLQVASRFPIRLPIQISDFRPGLAINEGIRASHGKFVVCLSAHCIPVREDWLENLLKGFEVDTSVAGVYGRQLPLSFSEPTDKRDLLITFGLDRRVQLKDYFFHNANSMIRRDVWEEIPFNEQVTNIEDRVWGKAVIEKGYRLVYEPEAAVYHHHGIHQNNSPQRAKNIVSIIEHFEKDAVNSLPESLQVENCNVVAVAPVLGEVKHVAGRNLLSDLIKQLQASKYLKSIYVLSENSSAEAIAKKLGARFIHRPEELLSTQKTIEDVLQYSLTQIEAGQNYPDAILSVNYLQPFRPSGLFDELIEDLQYKGLDAVFAGYMDYGVFWVRESDGSFKEMGEGLEMREHKQPIYESLYGLGCATASHIIRTGKLVGGRIGILPLDDRVYTLKVVDKNSEETIAAVFQHLAEREKVTVST